MVTEEDHRRNMQRISDSLKASLPPVSNKKKQPRVRKKSKPVRKPD